MSYKCQVCKQPVLAGIQRKVHVVKRKDGSIARELSVCDLCHAVLVGGTPVQQAMVQAGTAISPTVEVVQEVKPLTFRPTNQE